ncbi:MAG: hypothetical protein GTN49_06935 [candidate division Zixibacteria bacterium]|nr:hypothetical protein [candidate division Zixibacteria bacterium]
MRPAIVIALVIPSLAAAAAEPPSTYAEVAALVSAAERGETAPAEAFALVSAAPDAPLAGAALGRLHVLKSGEKPFILLKFLEMHRGFVALNKYVKKHREDPLPRVWRAASAVETDYVLWSVSNTREDLEAAWRFCERDRSLPDQTARCKLLLGKVAKDTGDLDEAMRLWGEAYAADPTGPTGKEVAKLLELFTG